MLCERCYGPIDPDTEGHYRLSHIDHADSAGNITWREAAVHTAACAAAGSRFTAEWQDRAA
ncbi:MULTISPECIES: hypothetical protein [Pseudonocardia]|nr:MULTISPECIES: hypothetical protein [Pseudonocardia]BBG02359.1 hypothetical protein Pdca_35680 [Pseudonocardia autotrophica]GEC23305.1 hypothetical protein PSA01_03340 [Pseudonocardia saturnea]